MTTQIKPIWFGGLTDKQAWFMANHAAVSPAFFAEVSCEGDRLFGLVTRCVHENCQDTCDWVLGECARATLWQYLYAEQQALEADLAWTLTPRYITETIPWNGIGHVQLTFGGVNNLNVQEDAELLEAGVEYNETVYTVTAIAVIGETFVTIDVPIELVSRPESVMLINTVTGTTVEYSDSVANYPRTYKDMAGDWFWRIAIPGRSGSAGDEFDVLDCRWGYVDVPVETECSEDLVNAEIGICYPNTFQRIPIEKTVDYTTYMRYFILHRNMVRDLYQGDTIKLDTNDLELHKLYDEIDLVCFYEVCALVTIRKRCNLLDENGSSAECSDCGDGTPCETTETDACATIVQGKAGVVAIEEVELITDDLGDPIIGDDGCPTFRHKGTPSCCSDDMEPYEIVISYHTDPGVSGIRYTSAVESLRRAIAARVAAEVPLNDCGCNVECGWFKEMRMELDTVRQAPSGATIVTLRYGRRRGQLMYASALQTAPRNQRVGYI